MMKSVAKNSIKMPKNSSNSNCSTIRTMKMNLNMLGKYCLLIILIILTKSISIECQQMQQQLLQLSPSMNGNIGLLQDISRKPLLSSSLSLLSSIDQNQMRYDAPDDCHFRPTSIAGEEIALTCNLRTVNSEFDTTNFSVIPSEHTIGLRIICNDEIMAKSSLEPKSFYHLVRLQELSIDYCKIARFNKDVLYNLNDLRNLTLRTHNINWPSLNLDIENDAFVVAKNLERLDLSQNNIWSLPENIFCPLNGLLFLNMSENRLQDINELGFRDRSQELLLNDLITTSTTSDKKLLTATMKTPSPSRSPSPSPSPTSPISTISTILTSTVTSQSKRKFQSIPMPTQQTSCLLDLETLDASNNHFVLLPANGFGMLRRLRLLKLENNEISMVADKALAGLKNLQIVNLSSNKIVALPSELFIDQLQSIQEVYLQNNSISVLSPKLFSNLEQLQALDLSFNQITSTWIDRNTFTGLIRLVLLNLSHNKITKLEPEIFSDLYTLQILNLRYNQLENIAADTFSPMNNLHTLLLSHNHLKYLDAYALNGLFVLSLLSLDNNALIGVHPDAFRNCSSLQDLNLNGNQLKSVPLALRNMRLLRTVDLGENMISILEETAFKGLNNLYGLRLIGNFLENITINSFKDLPSLQILNLARNRIQFVEIGTFEVTSSIQAIRLDGNELTEVHGLFSNMQNLLWLNVSDNRLEIFDFSEIPNTLQWLDLHKNQLIELTNHYNIDNQLRLQTLDVSFNQLTHVTPMSIPNSIELLFLNDNLITNVEPHSFMHKTNLTRVDLYANQITTLDLKSLRILPVSERRSLPEFYIGGNPFICDCNIEWLQKINHLSNRQYPRIMDLETIYCKLLNNRERAYIPLIDAEPKHFLCTYKTHCFALCHCCEFDACDCEMTCPNNCTCFHDQSWSTNIVECSVAGYSEMPTNIPMDTTEVYIDGNNFAELSGHSFIGRKNLYALYANNSNIQIIYNTTFSGLKRLSVLHLEDNKIIRLHGNEFSNLENLKEIYLQNNRITFIGNGTFFGMRKLEVLRLDGNRLIHFEVWQLQLNPYLVEIGLADNMWSCECSFLSRFRNYLQQSSEKIIDANRVACVYNNLTSILKEKNGTKCTLHEDISTYARKSEIEDLLPLLLTATCAFVCFFGLILGIFCYRHELRMWAHTNCLFSHCYKSPNFVENFDKDRLYDAYFVYSLQDDHFINQILANTLENDIGYRLSLHYRDLNVNTYIADSIIEAVESSKHVIIVLSKNFLYNEWSRFEFKSSLHEIIKRRKRLVFILYGDLPQRDIDIDMRHYLRTNTCIEWDDKKFWQKLRIAMPHIRAKRHCLSNRSAVNIYATTHDYGPSRGPDCSKRYECGNYATINDCGRNYASNFDGLTSCKYNTLNERPTKSNELVTKTIVERNHEYAIPSTVLLGGGSTGTGSGGGGGGGAIGGGASSIGGSNNTGTTSTTTTATGTSGTTTASGNLAAAITKTPTAINKSEIASNYYNSEYERKDKSNCECYPKKRTSGIIERVGERSSAAGIERRGIQRGEIEREGIGYPLPSPGNNSSISNNSITNSGKFYNQSISATINNSGQLSGEFTTTNGNNQKVPNNFNNPNTNLNQINSIKNFNNYCRNNSCNCSNSKYSDNVCQCNNRDSHIYESNLSVNDINSIDKQLSATINQNSKSNTNIAQQQQQQQQQQHKQDLWT